MIIEFPSTYEIKGNLDPPLIYFLDAEDIAELQSMIVNELLATDEE